VTGRRDPRWPRRSHHDAGVALTWELKDALPGRRAVYYGRLLKGRPVLVALDLFPAFYALVRGRQGARDYRAEYQAGRLSHPAKRLMDVLIRRHAVYTREWRAEALMLDPGATRTFERAVAELQQGLFVVKTAERYEPSFSYRWDLVEAWLPDAVREGRRLPRAEAVRRLVERHVGGAGWASVRGMARLFALPADEVRAAVAALARAGTLVTGIAVPGLPGDLVIASPLLGATARRRVGGPGSAALPGAAGRRPDATASARRTSAAVAVAARPRAAAASASRGGPGGSAGGDGSPPRSRAAARPGVPTP